MKTIFLFLFLSSSTLSLLQGQPAGGPEQAIRTLIDTYSRARDAQDTVLLKSILTNDLDQLVSTGEWREGIRGAMAGMARSTQTTPGGRSLQVEKIRFLSPESALVDARYVTRNTDGTERHMWSTFVVLRQKRNWKITAIRNMLPSAQR
jgi:uncharacterized protein (TIGR02246 family)